MDEDKQVAKTTWFSDLPAEKQRKILSFMRKLEIEKEKKERGHNFRVQNIMETDTITLSAHLNHLNMEQNTRDFHHEYVYEEVIAMGGFGIIYIATRIRDGLTVTVKELPKRKRVIPAINNVPLEVALMQLVQDIPGVIKIIDYFDMKDYLYIVMEKFHSKDLFDFITEAGPLPEATAKAIFKQLAQAVISCHMRGVLHGDLKDENILIDPNNLQIKLIDFGAGTLLNNNASHDFSGTRVYSPPE